MKTEIPDLTGYQAKHFLWRVDYRVGPGINDLEHQGALNVGHWRQMRGGWSGSNIGRTSAGDRNQADGDAGSHAEGDHECKVHSHRDLRHARG